jgi:hypothetical protein
MATRPIIAECGGCRRPFVAGSGGGGSMTLGPPGSSVYISHMETRGGVVQMEGVKVSCPYCGEMGRVPDGLYDFVSETRQVFQRFTAEQNRAILLALRRYEAGEIDEAQVEAEAPAEALALIRSTLKEADKKYWISLLVMILICLVQWRMSDESTSAIEQRVEQAQAASAQEFRRLNQNEQAVCDEVSKMMRQADAARGVAVKATKRLPVPRDSPPLTTMSQPGVLPNKNDPCWCGSNKKFKRCHRYTPG